MLELDNGQRASHKESGEWAGPSSQFQEIPWWLFDMSPDMIIRKKFFTMRVVTHWHSLPREAVDVPSLAVLKARLDGALSNLV